MQQTIGKRIAQLRQEQGWTQQELAGRVAISRVAVSHLEMDLSIPGERTVTLLAGVFKLSPHELVAGTTYPTAKAERLPLVACCYTELELNLALLQNDLAWLERLGNGRERAQLAAGVWETWLPRLISWREEAADGREREMIMLALGQLQEKHCLESDATRE